MRRIREIIEKYHIHGLSQVETSRATGVSRSTVQNYLERLSQTGLTAREAIDLSDIDLEKKLFPASPVRLFGASQQLACPLPDWEAVTKEMIKKGVTRRLLWVEYCKEHPDGIKYSRFCLLFKRYLRLSKLSMRQEHKAGETVFTDYSGDKPRWVDRDTGEVHQCELFVMSWGASNYTYAEVHNSQKEADWIGAHVRAYAFFGCAPYREVPDNLKSGVIKSCRYDPDRNPAYSDMSHHYHIAVIPARVSKPKDKAKVENSVQQSQRWILARMRNMTFYSMDELNSAVKSFLGELNAKPMDGYGGKSRHDLFEEIDKPAAQPLPCQPWEQREWIRCRVGVDYCVQVDKRSYSVPYTYVGKELTAILSERLVKIFCGDEQIALHERITKLFGFSIKDEHRPEKHRNVYAWTPERIRIWAHKTGPATAEYIHALFKSKKLEEEAYRPALGILRIAEKYPVELVEKASKIALSRRMFRTAQFQDILQSPLLYREEHELPPPPVKHENLRGLAHYAELVEGSL